MSNGKRKDKGTWSFEIDNKSHDVKGVWKKDKGGNSTFKPSIFGNKSMKEHFGVSARKTFKTIEENKKKTELGQTKLRKIDDIVRGRNNSGPKEAQPRITPGPYPKEKKMIFPRKDKNPVEPSMPVRYDDLGPEGKKLWDELRN